MEEKDKKPSFGQVVLSTLAAAIGVQSDKNRERDFKGGSIKTYIAAGVIFTAGLGVTYLCFAGIRADLSSFSL